MGGRVVSCSGDSMVNGGGRKWLIIEAYTTVITEDLVSCLRFVLLTSTDWTFLH